MAFTSCLIHIICEGDSIFAGNLYIHDGGLILRHVLFIL